MKDYAVKVTIKNGRILHLMEQAGIETQSDLARRSGINPNRISAILNLKIPPRRPRDGQWRDDVIRIAGVLQCDPEEMFTEAQENMALPNNSATIGMDEVQVERLTSGGLERDALINDTTQRLLACLTPRERTITEAIMNGATLDEASEDDERGCGRERMNQIYKKSLRKMKTAAKRMQLKDIEDEIYG